ncbi:MAG TPA: hypothetical protein PKV95_11785, partial [Anaerolineaceae bacterium]|nr:hypothetical protein [Anaerolineaceae bacterium]
FRMHFAADCIPNRQHNSNTCSIFYVGQLFANPDPTRGGYGCSMFHVDKSTGAEWVAGNFGKK